MKLMLILFLYVWLILIQTVRLDIYRAVIKMEMLSNVEQDMLRELNKYITDSENNGYELPESVKVFQNETIKMNLLSPQPHFLENPINAFHFVKRMYFDWTRVLADINCDDCLETSASKDFNNKLTALELESRVGIRATETDYHGSGLGLVRLWQTYKLNLTALFRGEILDTKTNPLTVEDILLICQILDETNSYYKEIIWLQELLTYIQANTSGEVKTVTKVRRRLAAAFSKYGMPWTAAELIADELSRDPENKLLKRDMQYFNSKTTAIQVENRVKTLQPDQVDLNKAHYESLCRGEGIRSRRVTSRIKCYLRETEIPIYRVKEEVMSFAPRLSVFYDVTTEKERSYLKEVVMTLVCLNEAVSVCIVLPQPVFTVISQSHSNLCNYIKSLV